MISFETSGLLRLYSLKRWMSGRGWTLSSNVDLEASIVAKKFALSDKMTPGSFMTVGINTLPRLIRRNKSNQVVIQMQPQN